MSKKRSKSKKVPNIFTDPRWVIVRNILLEQGAEDILHSGRNTNYRHIHKNVECNVFTFNFYEKQRKIVLYFAEFSDEIKEEIQKNRDSRRVSVVFPYHADEEKVAKMKDLIIAVMKGWSVGIKAERQFTGCLPTIVSGIECLTDFREATEPENKTLFTDFYLLGQKGNQLEFTLPIDVKNSPTPKWDDSDKFNSFHLRADGVFEVVISNQRGKVYKDEKLLQMFTAIIDKHLKVY